MTLLDQAEHLSNNNQSLKNTGNTYTPEFKAEPGSQSREGKNRTVQPKSRKRRPNMAARIAKPDAEAGNIQPPQNQKSSRPTRKSINRDWTQREKSCLRSQHQSQQSRWTSLKTNGKS